MEFETQHSVSYFQVILEGCEALIKLTKVSTPYANKMNPDSNMICLKHMIALFP